MATELYTVLSICFKRKKERWQISEERTKIYTMSETKIKMKSKEAQMIVTNFSGLNSKSMFYQYWKDDNEMIIEAWICKADELQNKLDNIKKLLQDARKDNL